MSLTMNLTGSNAALTIYFITNLDMPKKITTYEMQSKILVHLIARGVLHSYYIKLETLLMRREGLKVVLEAIFIDVAQI